MVESNSGTQSAFFKTNFNNNTANQLKIHEGNLSNKTQALILPKLQINTDGVITIQENQKNSDN